MKDDRRTASTGTSAKREDRIRQEIKLLVRRISDDVWAAAVDHAVEGVIRRVPRYGSHGVDYELIKACVTADVGRKMLQEIIAREFVSRLSDLIADGAGLRLDLRFLGSEVSDGGAMRFLRMIVPSDDLLAIYQWNVARIDARFPIVPKGLEELNEWDRGLYLDSIVRSVPPGELHGVSNYSRIFGAMSSDGFITSALLIAVRHFHLFEQDRGTDQCTLH
jgi:hypothetical protein